MSVWLELLAGTTHTEKMATQHTSAAKPWRSTMQVTTDSRLTWRERYAAHGAEYASRGADPANTVRGFVFLEDAIRHRQSVVAAQTRQRWSRSRAKRQKRAIKKSTRPFSAQRAARKAALRAAMADPKSRFYSPGLTERSYRSTSKSVADIRLWATFQLAETMNWAERSENYLKGNPVSGMRPGKTEHAWWAKTERSRVDVSDIRDLLDNDIDLRRRLSTSSRRARRQAIDNGTMLSRTGRLRTYATLGRAHCRNALWSTAEGAVRGAINTGKTTGAALVLAAIKSPAAMKAFNRFDERMTKSLMDWSKAKGKVIARVVVTRSKELRAEAGKKLAELGEALEKREQRLAQQSSQRGKDRLERRRQKSQAQRERTAQLLDRRADPLGLPRSLKRDGVDKVFGPMIPKLTGQDAKDYAEGISAFEAAVRNGRFTDKAALLSVVRAQHVGGVQPGEGLGKLAAALGNNDLAVVGLQRNGTAIENVAQSTPTPVTPTPARATTPAPTPAPIRPSTPATGAAGIAG